MSSVKINDFWAYPILIIISIVFLLILSISTSPLYSGYGGDSAVFIMFGRMFNSGKIPYIDFFDHKGPMLIFIQSFAQKIYPPDNRLATFILQIINISIVQIFFYKTLRLLLNPVNSISICIFILIFFRYTIEGGNLTEEYSLLFITIPFYFTLKASLSRFDSLSKIQCLIVGLCSAMLFWIRLNNTGTVFACMLFIGILLVKDKKWKTLFNSVFYFLVGFLIITVPLLIYFVNNNALTDMINAAFIHNLKYVESSHPEDYFKSKAIFALYIFKAWLPFVLLVAGTIIYFLKTKNRSSILFSVILIFFCYITTHIGNEYYHYMTLNILLLLLGCAYLLNSITNKKIINGIFCIMLLATLGVLIEKAYYLKPFDYENTFNDDAQEISKQIPLNERNSVYPYQTQNSFLPASGLQPCYKYFMMQEWTGIANKSIITQINNMMQQHPPKWVVTQYRTQSTNTKFWKIINTKYSLYFKNNNFELFKLKNN